MQIDAASAREMRSCESCGQTFKPARADAVFCTAACRQRAYRRRGGVTDNSGVALRIPLPLSELHRLANEHRERIYAHAGPGFDPAIVERELRATMAAEVPPERVEIEFARVTEYLKTHTWEGFEVIEWWPPDAVCAQCGEGFASLIRSPLKGVPDALLHWRCAAAWFGARILEVGRDRP